MVPLALLAALAAAPPAAHVELEVTAAGVTRTSTVSNKARDRFRMVPAEKGTVLISVEPIHGPAPHVRLVTAEGKTLRRGVRGKTFARPAPGTTLFLEVAPPYKDASSTYHLSVAFDVDRPRPLRDQPRAVRPRDIVRVPSRGVHELDQVSVGGLTAEYAVSGGDVLVTIPAFARAGRVELRYESRAPKVVEVALIGTVEAVDRTGSCAGTCIELSVSPSVDAPWIDTIARLLDADLVAHAIGSGRVLLQLRLASSEGYALEQLRMMPGVLSARRAP